MQQMLESKEPVENDFEESYCSSLCFSLPLVVVVVVVVHLHNIPDVPDADAGVDDGGYLGLAKDNCHDASSLRVHPTPCLFY